MRLLQQQGGPAACTLVHLHLLVLLLPIFLLLGVYAGDQLLQCWRRQASNHLLQLTADQAPARVAAAHYSATAHSSHSSHCQLLTRGQDVVWLGQATAASTDAPAAAPTAAPGSQRLDRMQQLL
jgi:hypothetical protein